MSVLIGVDVGGTTISGGLVSKDGEVLTVVTEDTAAPGPGSAVDTVLRVIDELVARAGRRHLGLDGVGIGLPGLVDTQKGMMISTMNLVPEFAHVPLADGVRARTGLPAFVDNDVNAQALGEWTFGVGRGASSLVLLALGTGVGGSIIIGGTLVRGHNGAAAEFGHVPIDLDGPSCMCGGRGCLDLYVGGRNLAHEAKRRIAREPGDVQIAVYGLVAARLAEEWRTPRRVGAAYVYVGRGPDERAWDRDFHEALEPAARDWLATAAALLAERAFPRTPRAEDCDYCRFRPVCGEGVYERAARVLASGAGALERFRALKGGEPEAED